MEKMMCCKCAYPFDHSTGMAWPGCPLCKSIYVKWSSYSDQKNAGLDKQKYLTTEQAIRKYGAIHGTSD